MSLKAASQLDLHASPSSLGPWKPLSLSSGSVEGRQSRARDGQEEVLAAPRTCRRPVRVVRPVSALSPNASFLQISRLQGELVRKRKECEDLKQENKFLSNEIHMERIVMRTENELTMRNLRGLNQELQGQIKELKQKLHISQQRVTLCSKAAEDAEVSHGEAERARAMAEARLLDIQKDRELVLAEKMQLVQEHQQLKNRHMDIQLLLAQTEKNYFETKLKLDRVSSDKQVLVEANRGLEEDKKELRMSQKLLAEENAKLREKEASSRRKAVAAEEVCERVSQARRDAERQCRLAEQETRERAEESLSWKEKHQAMAATLKALEDLRSQRQNKASQANIKSYFLCMTESDQRIKILKNSDGSPRNFTEGDPVYISTADTGGEDAGERTQERIIHRVTAPSARSSFGPAHFSELSPMGPEAPDTGPRRSGRRVVEYFWLPTDDQ
ncbi:uncharacterized protein LOC125706821 [Brienomyrus brachyistius]|uniref:uncharacterized protein LOC125706821 n=1 Tax=Brienomyrus brachyistius TaxID=42636 RepID=UPI0020B235C4|nr:uncharacterized protein LOC125706821 [Brienomyrus brachyistius]